jgi:hypothetical protein
VNTYNVPITSTVVENSVAFELWDRDTGLYIQDKWAATRKLTVNAGVRFETNFGWQPAGCRAANTFVAETCWDEIKGNPDFKGIVPRVSAIYDIKGDGRTAIKFAASRYDQPINISINQRLNPVGTTNDHARGRPARRQDLWLRLERRSHPAIERARSSTGFTFGTTNRYDPNLKWPVSNEYSLEVQRQLFQDTVLTVGYTNRQTRRNIGFRNVAVPIDTYIPLQVTEVNSGKQVTVYNQAPALRGKHRQPVFQYRHGQQRLQRRRHHDRQADVEQVGVNGGVSFGKTLGEILAQDLNIELGGVPARAPRQRFAMVVSDVRVYELPQGSS